ncbi:MAG: PQQ-dependent sugar dehydrogenase, partial [Gammaproteobacteria bacterium]|nr:PQQ-dependent sugar dehydrogenase [Gammaproteobacteria bacterium]
LQLNNEKYNMRVPQGYTIELLTELESPRLITVIENGDLLIGSKSGDIYRVPPPYNKPEILVSLDDYPHSVALRKNELLIARTNGLYRAPYQSGQKKIRNRDVTFLAALPGGRGHNSRTVAIGPDDRVYLSLGITGNCSNQYLDKSYPFNDRRGGVLVLNESGGKAEWEAFGSGLRNPVGYDWHPVTKVMYASNNGPDHLGYELPPEYFSRVTPNSFHGMPWFQYNGRDFIRDECIESKPPRSIDGVSVPVATFPARNAPMGVSFVPGRAMDKNLEYDAIVALHGSWGTKPSGSYMGSSATRRHPKLVVIRFENGKAVRVDDLVTGFQLEDGERLARPVGVAIGTDGALYFTSDGGKHGLYRLRKIK